MAEYIDVNTISNEMLEVLAKHKVSMNSLDRVLQHLRELAYCNTLVQKAKSNNESKT